MLNRMTLPLFLICLLIGTEAMAAAGRVISLRGDVWAHVGDRPERVLRTGSIVFPNDELRTGRRSSVRVRFQDGSRFDLGPSTRMEVGEYSYEQPAKKDSFTSRILKGSFRFFSGLMAKKRPQSMRVRTAVATIGIRGTHVAGEVTETTARIILMDPEDTEASAIVVSNEFGSVTIDEPGYGTEVPDEHSPPSPVRRMKLDTINNIMRSLQSIQRIRPITPRF